jgi:hypothetical protein
VCVCVCVCVCVWLPDNNKRIRTYLKGTAKHAEVFHILNQRTQLSSPRRTSAAISKGSVNTRISPDTLLPGELAPDARLLGGLAPDARMLGGLEPAPDGRLVGCVPMDDSLLGERLPDDARLVGEALGRLTQRVLANFSAISVLTCCETDLAKMSTMDGTPPAAPL